MNMSGKASMIINM